MNKKLKKLTLSRDTLYHLDSGGLGAARGGQTNGALCLSVSPQCSATCSPSDGGTGSDASICQTCGVCSNGCATGGACTT